MVVVRGEAHAKRSKRTTGSYMGFKEYITNSDVERILELGSRDGKDAILLRDYFDAEVASFECNPPQVRICERALKDEERIQFVPLAVWEETGTIPFIPVIEDSGYVKVNQPIPCVRIEEWCEENDFVPDLICMDLQGSELPALRGAGKILAQVRHIISEVQFDSHFDGTPLHSDIEDFLKPWDFFESATIGVNTWYGESLFSRKW